jgi:hypothetical protein
MMTVRHIERLFSNHQHPRLYRELIAGRPEATANGLDSVLSRVVPIAALGMIRLDELSQTQTSLYRRLMSVVLTAQHPVNGGWGDCVTTAIAVRALLGNASTGHGQAIERGLAYLANSQTDTGLWTPEGSPDPLASAFVLLQLGDRAAFRQAVRFVEAVDWFNAHARSTQLDASSKRLWSHASVRCRMTPADRDGFATLWTPAAATNRRPAA